MMSKLGLVLAAALASFAMAGAAKAATDTLSLTGTVAGSVYGTLTSGGVTYNTWTLPLSGLDSTNSLTVSQGDTVDGTLTLDQKYTVNIPMSSDVSVLEVTFGGMFFLGNNTATDELTFFNGLSKGIQAGGDTNDANGLIVGALLVPSQTITFDSVELNYQITALGGGGPATLTSATLEAFVPNGSFGTGGGGGGGGGVPEPAAWNLMLVGFGGLGAALRSRRRSAAATAE